MNDVQVTLVGQAVTTPKVDYVEPGVAVTNFRVMARPRRYDKASGGWVDGVASFYRVNCWRLLAEHVAASLVKGEPVVVTGRLHVRQWQAGEVWRNSPEVDAIAVGHDMRWGVSSFRRAERKAERGPEQLTVAIGDGSATAETAQNPAEENKKEDQAENQTTETPVMDAA